MKIGWAFISLLCSLLTLEAFAQRPLPLDSGKIGNPQQPLGNQQIIKKPKGTIESSPLGPFIGRRWLGTVEISPGVMDDSSPYVSSAGSPSGHAVVVWLQSSPDNLHGKSVWANFYIPRQGWRGAELVEAFVESSLDPSVATDGLGNSIVIWRQTEADRQHERIVSRYYNLLEGWREPVFLTDAIEVGGEGLQMPFITLNHNGEGLAVWSQWRDNARHHRFFSRFFSQGRWGETEQIADVNTRNGVTLFKANITSKGQIFALWADPLVDHPELAGWHLAAHGQRGWEQPIPLGQDVVDIVGMRGEIPFLSLDKILLAWGGGGNLWSQVYSLTEGLGEKEIIGRGRGESLNYAADVALDGRGNAFAIWNTQGGIGVNRFDSVRGWGQSVDVAPQGENTDYAPSVATDSSGNAVVVWYRQQQAGLPRVGELYDSWVCHYETDGGWKPATLLGHIDGGSISFYDVVRVGQDRFIAVGSKRAQDGRRFIVAKEYR